MFAVKVKTWLILMAKYTVYYTSLPCCFPRILLVPNMPITLFIHVLASINFNTIEYTAAVVFLSSDRSSLHYDAP